MKSLKDVELTNKSVGLRVDLNVPIDNLLYEKLEGQIYHPGKSSSLRPVSYTHLTLPTIYSV